MKFFLAGLFVGLTIILMVGSIIKFLEQFL